MANKGLSKALTWFVIPVIAIIVLFVYSRFLGTAALIIYILAIIILQRATFLMTYGSVCYNKKDLEGALKWYEKAYNTGKTYPKAKISYAYILLKCGRTDDAGAVMDKLLDEKLSTEDHNLAQTIQALIVWKKGDLDRSVGILEKVIAEYKTTTIYGSLGYLLILKGDLDKALAFNLEAYDYNSANVVIADNLGQTYYLRNEQDKAIEIYNRLMLSNPPIPEAFYNYGLVLLKKGCIQEALNNFNKAGRFRLTSLSTVTEEEIALKTCEAEKLLSIKAAEDTGINDSNLLSD